MGINQQADVHVQLAEDFTSRHDAIMNTGNIHGNAAEIVRSVDYMSGRTLGKHSEPCPLVYRSKNEIIKKIHMVTHESNKTNLNRKNYDRAHI
jgi:hypothetical protein